MGVELRPGPKGLDKPSNPTGAVVATGAGLRASPKGLDIPPDPTATRVARPAATFGVTEQRSAEAIVIVRPWTGDAVKGRT